jgi:hypothetical protein
MIPLGIRMRAARTVVRGHRIQARAVDVGLNHGPPAVKLGPPTVRVRRATADPRWASGRFAARVLTRRRRLSPQRSLRRGDSAVGTSGCTLLGRSLGPAACGQIRLEAVVSRIVEGIGESAELSWEQKRAARLSRAPGLLSAVRASRRNHAAIARSVKRERTVVRTSSRGRRPGRG